LTKAADALLEGLIDYAGLFPPAGEDMRPALENYASYALGPDRRALGRFIVPIARLSELEKEGSDLMPRAKRTKPWRLSVLVAEDLAGAVEEIARFNHVHGSASRKGRAQIDVVELKATTPDEIGRQRTDLPQELTPYVEIPLSGEMPALVAALAQAAMRGKVRTGGVTADAFPAAEKIADFIVACAVKHVPFKATAGLHHPVCGEYRLTYEPDSASTHMFGFVNVFVAAALVHAGEGEATCVAVLKEDDRSAFRFDDGAIAWRDKRLTTGQIAAARSGFAIAFGSCSFREPVDELAILTRKARATDK
jgi:hypothetical protein